MNDEILEIVKSNEEIARKFSKIETKISSVSSARELFEVLLPGIEEEFDIPFVWLSIVADGKVSGLLETLYSSETFKDRLNVIGKGAFLDLIAHDTIPVLANDGLRPFYKLFPPNRKFFIKSLAVAPIALDGDIIGSLNHGDFSSLRYQPGMDTSLLKRLATKVSSCLSDIMALER
ncbi:MAG: GAF domain-containing protein [Syntrophales bacterium]|nr:GAF domain-containing protein [Syntrophales bacterium]